MEEQTIYADGSYLARNPGWHDEDAGWKAAKIREILARNAVAPGHVAEIGCGTGGVLSALVASLGPAVRGVGYEVSPQAFAIAEARATERVAFHLDVPLESLAGCFDVTLVIDVIEHLEDYFGFLRQVRPTARYKVFHIPLDLSAQTVLRGRPLMKWREDVGHLHYFIKDTALAALAETGYRVIDHCYTATALERPNRGFRAELLRLPRRVLSRLAPDLAARALGGFSLLVLAE